MLSISHLQEFMTCKYVGVAYKTFTESFIGKAVALTSDGLDVHFFARRGKAHFILSKRPCKEPVFRNQVFRVLKDCEVAPVSAESLDVVWSTEMESRFQSCRARLIRTENKETASIFNVPSKK